MSSIYFVVYGKPAPRGSKRAIPFRKGDGKLGVGVKDMSERSRDWMEMCASAAAQVYRGELLDGPLRLTVQFYFARPSGHYSKSKEHAGRLLDSAPKHHAQVPDLSKLLRALEDSLTGVVWRDDRQICEYGESTGKSWTCEQARADVLIESLNNTRRTTMPLFTEEH